MNEKEIKNKEGQRSNKTIKIVILCIVVILIVGYITKEKHDKEYQNVEDDSNRVYLDRMEFHLDSKSIYGSDFVLISTRNNMGLSEDTSLVLTVNDTTNYSLSTEDTNEFKQKTYQFNENGEIIDSKTYKVAPRVEMHVYEDGMYSVYLKNKLFYYNGNQYIKGYDLNCTEALFKWPRSYYASQTYITENKSYAVECIHENHVSKMMFSSPDNIQTVDFTTVGNKQLSKLNENEYVLYSGFSISSGSAIGFTYPYMAPNIINAQKFVRDSETNEFSTLPLEQISYRPIRALQNGYKVEYYGVEDAFIKDGKAYLSMSVKYDNDYDYYNELIIIDTSTMQVLTQKEIFPGDEIEYYMLKCVGFLEGNTIYYITKSRQDDFSSNYYLVKYNINTDKYTVSPIEAAANHRDQFTMFDYKYTTNETYFLVADINSKVANVYKMNFNNPNNPIFMYTITIPDENMLINKGLRFTIIN